MAATNRHPGPIELTIMRQLMPGERPLWSGRPQRGLRLRRADLILLPAGIVWATFACLWEATALGLGPDGVQQAWGPGGAPGAAHVWGLLLLALSCHLLVGHHVLDAFRRARTYYGVSDRRVIIVCGLFVRRVRSIPLAGLRKMSVDEGHDHVGTIALGPAPPMHFAWAAMLWPELHGRFPDRFEMVADARRVYGLIRRTAAPTW